MADKNSERKKIWIYATILFMSAFIVLLFTAYSQIRLNGNISDYKNQLNSNTKEKNDFQINLNSCLKLNSQLNNQIKAANKQISQIKQDEKKANSSLLSEKDKTKRTIAAYDYLLAAESAYNLEEISICAKVMYEKCDPAYLSKMGIVKYNYLKKMSFEKASIILYFSGYHKFKNKDYKNALADLQLSVNLSKLQYISDDCYYFIAYCAFNTGNLKLLMSSLDTLEIIYPNSTYKDAANNLRARASKLVK